MKKNKGRLFLISGPSGSGKDTVLAKIFEKFPDIRFSISSITRDMREGEVEGEKYNFISREQFEKMIAEDKLLEYNVFVGNYYGTPAEPVEHCIEEGKDIFVEIDVNGAAQIRKKKPEAISIFIMPPSLSLLRERLTARGTENAEQIEKRLFEAKREIMSASEYDYIVINDDLSRAVNEVADIINGKIDSNRDTRLIDKILNS